MTGWLPRDPKPKQLKHRQQPHSQSKSCAHRSLNSSVLQCRSNATEHAAHAKEHACNSEHCYRACYTRLSSSLKQSMLQSICYRALLQRIATERAMKHTFCIDTGRQSREKKHVHAYMHLLSLICDCCSHQTSTSKLLITLHVKQKENARNNN